MSSTTWAVVVGICVVGISLLCAAESGHGPTPPRPPEPMVQQILGQNVLDHPRVRPYLHTEVATNLPLTVHAVSGLEQVPLG